MTEHLTSSSALFKDYIQDAIISEVKTQSQGLLYTVEADEVTDVSNWEQLDLVIRYLRDAQPVERLVEYVQCEIITGRTADMCNTVYMAGFCL